MKKLLIGLPVLVTISVFVTEIKNFNDPSIEMNKLSYSYRATSNGDELCKLLTTNQNAQIESRIAGRMFITLRYGVSRIVLLPLNSRTETNLNT